MKTVAPSATSASASAALAGTLVDRHCDLVLPAPQGHSAFMPANRITLPHFSVSSAIELAECRG